MFNVDDGFGCLHFEAVGCVVDITGELTSYVFRVEEGSDQTTKQNAN
jgi:hypothetical protein